MGLTVSQRLGDGSLALIDRDVLDVARRMQEGDPTLGWPGERDLELAYDHDTRTFVAVHRDLTGAPYIAARSATCDDSLIRKLVENDKHHHDVAAEIDRHNDALEAAAAKAYDDVLENELNPKARWAIRRDIGWDTKGQYAGWTRAPKAKAVPA